MVWLAWSVLGQGMLHVQPYDNLPVISPQVWISLAQSLTELGGRGGRNAAGAAPRPRPQEHGAAGPPILTVEGSSSTAWPCFPQLHGLSVERHPRFPQWLVVLWNNPFSHPMCPVGQSGLFLMDLSLPLSPTRMDSRALEYRTQPSWVSLPDDSSGNQSPRVNAG